MAPDAFLPLEVLATSLRVAAGFTGAYVLWLIVFERWAEPAMRRATGRAFRGVVDWHRSTGPFRTWWLRGATSPERSAAVSLLCNALVLSAAVAPALAVGLLTSMRVRDEATNASIYLMTLPMMTFFSFRILWHRGETD